MSFAKYAGRLSWLTAALAQQRLRVAQLLGRLSDLGPEQGLKPGLFRKFMVMLDQIAAEKDQETRLIARIEALENQHRYRRRHRLLRRPPAPATDRDIGRDDADAKPKNAWYWYLLLWIFAMRQKTLQQKQDLKVG